MNGKWTLRPVNGGASQSRHKFHASLSLLRAMVVDFVVSSWPCNHSKHIKFKEQKNFALRRKFLHFHTHTYAIFLTFNEIMPSIFGDCRPPLAPPPLWLMIKILQTLVSIKFVYSQFANIQKFRACTTSVRKWMKNESGWTLRSGWVTENQRFSTNRRLCVISIEIHDSRPIKTFPFLPIQKT